MDRGLYRKYAVTRLDAQERDYSGKHVQCEYFVLDLTHDEEARAAAIMYAGLVRKTKPELARQLIILSKALDGG